MYVITGATGNTGSIVAHNLLNNDQEVKVISRNKEKLKHLFEKKF